MIRTQSKSEGQLIETFRISLANVENQPKIAATMAEFGYDLSTITKGRELLEATISAFNFNQQEDNETIQARADFDAKVTLMTEKYTSHRRKAKVAFRKDEVVLKQLGLAGNYSKAYTKWITTMKTFYNGVQTNAAHLAKLLVYKITEEEIAACITEINALETTRTLYLKEVGESQEATKLKDKALADLEEWMSDFYAVAKIAMEDQPQLLESLGLLVRS
ncbi:hypothetical protein QUH73_12230 [Labilibaculum sp. K2S]|uniref:hypothetical protein n=1 Tax=Labilibaculum sp. K2S TaxID=3056386 RepID=UPI0025A3547D|nr:hypothetical protein [Labilibaculum sp. K2S]MDM8160584.1 hypothetical protein [Labilibaculum sp. K2S]